MAFLQILRSRKSIWIFYVLDHWQNYQNWCFLYPHLLKKITVFSIVPMSKYGTANPHLCNLWEHSRGSTYKEGHSLGTLEWEPLFTIDTTQPTPHATGCLSNVSKCIYLLHVFQPVATKIFFFFIGLLKQSISILTLSN